ncbi:MAG: tRNA 2-thiouridine(34) synthase MnmA [Candidatus Magasanikbacteria bacterium RIFCSPHIGHO2_01_FULL_41_23]|uniref:tRNA-specific 2-thiouridylase MnmA n=1 Tax=Candidatus Magasanikbacteria bacterium RIFCSPLOWO2_01_FULL_40_15 TaxID=1798686 RepID=A0A1F6N2Q5_9BACT|nr:MAG: tRNA 2-thiouridine(34) synthase MnmA [Candidatus Magasanikbacteria bacterium RIFCSPHIGHO2_01_FULL_41_23]OGH76457.1 MAG: tRNA 2-thiouridine(34) synthase MnmA [Candidatus Magasanikbacteria bacterium RIFCSPHIGHO2_12_FULL_41_16]OGH77943.1 MAG: tRNA 2-thiouridine(34) synthase MnmA [Candidatus Magasanikbacteria bacterium RIFCSPLOWO2_01_FULL_40_15]
MKKNQKSKILVCLSGGVDSSVTAALLVRAGHDVTAAFMIQYRSEDENCWRYEYRDAVRVAAHLGIPLLRFDFTKEYEKKVLQKVYKEYEAGRTPNPDILCNQYIKFGVWLEKANELGFDYLATGHYARIKKKAGEYFLATSKDTRKDQTYFLHQLNQKQLAYTLFPIGNYAKTQVRTLAKKFKLPTADKAESMGICFIGEVPMKKFLQPKIKSKPGSIISTNGEEVGRHSGLAFATIGQRHNTGIAKQGTALYVVGKNLAKNTLIVGAKDDPKLLQSKIIIENMHWISGQKPKLPLRCMVRLRHQQSLQKCRIESLDKIIFDKPQWGVTPGQYAVLYQNNICLGGGAVATINYPV